MSLATSFVGDISYIDLIFVVILGWILVNVWQRFIDNFTFNYLGLRKESSYHTFVIALVLSLIFFAFIFTFDSILNNIVESDTGDLAPPSGDL